MQQQDVIRKVLQAITSPHNSSVVHDGLQQPRHGGSKSIFFPSMQIATVQQFRQPWCTLETLTILISSEHPWTGGPAMSVMSLVILGSLMKQAGTGSGG